MLDKADDAVSVAEHTYEFFEFLFLLENNISDGEQNTLRGRAFGFHIPCHQRPLGAGEHAMAFLRQRGADVALIETGTCCGMAGTFGLKAGPLGYELAQAVGEPLFEGFREADVEAIVTESSVCAIHLSEGTELEVWHPLNLLRLLE